MVVEVLVVVQHEKRKVCNFFLSKEISQSVKVFKDYTAIVISSIVLSALIKQVAIARIAAGFYIIAPFIETQRARKVRTLVSVVR